MTSRFDRAAASNSVEKSRRLRQQSEKLQAEVLERWETMRAQVSLAEERLRRATAAAAAHAAKTDSPPRAP